jgi:methionyl-tRNA formyltransferase
LRIIFAGTPANASKTLEALVDAGYNVVGVLTRSDAPTGRNSVVTESAVAEMAGSLAIPMWKSNSVDEAALNWISGLNADLGVIVAYGSILRTEVLGIPSRGWINLHYSLLPKYPGASPVQQAILEGATSTGVSVFELDEGVDSGPILSAQEIDIKPNESAGELLERLTDEGSKLLVGTLHEFDSLYSSRAAQPADVGRAVTKKITRSIARLDFNLSAENFVNKVRAMNPEPVAWFELNSLPVRVLEASVSGATQLEPGIATLDDSELVVGCLAGSVVLKTVQPAGKKPMSGADWFRGLRRDSLLLS